MNTQRELRPLLEYDGKTGELYGIFFKNLLLSLVTFGIYRFWATTNLRRYVWSRMRFQRERFEYTGTGGELFKGFLLALAIVVGSLVGDMVLSRVIVAITGSTTLGLIPLIVVSLGIAVLGAGAHFSAQRYRLSRTVWRGIRGGMSGSALQYGVRVLLYGLLCVVSLYQLIPWMSMRLAERRINASSFGSATFRFKGSAGKLYGTFVLCFAGCIALVELIVHPPFFSSSSCRSPASWAAFVGLPRGRRTGSGAGRCESIQASTSCSYQQSRRECGILNGVGMRCWYLALVAQVRMVVGVLPIRGESCSTKRMRGSSS